MESTQVVQKESSRVVSFPDAGERQISSAPRTFAHRLWAAVGRRMRRIWQRLEPALMRLAARSGRLSSWYYALFDRSFDREHRAVLVGRLAWERSRTAEGATSSLLRRNVHRLEKGLLMRPRRRLFALDYIEETFLFYEAAVLKQGEHLPLTVEELHWAHDVLREYFTVTDAHPRLDGLRERFFRLPQPSRPSQEDRPWRPYKRDLSVPPTVEYEDLLALAWRRRSVRWFLPDPVPRELIEKAIDVAKLSPSACNRQPFQFRVFDDPDLVPKVASLPGGTAGFYHQFPVIVVLVGELRNYYGERDRHLIYIDASLAAMSFVFACETLGLGTCCINWPDIEEDEKRAEEMLQLAPDQRPIMFIAVGFPDPEGMVAYSQKKPNSQICRYNFE
ncbi:nitroreductase family protein [Rhodocaloribacter litoris]|uniref:nitroreductase family protein n=1 Tax=Rhodocaloribacter litoris TaxID=2558931 RepID=UPI001E5AA1B6|nr:nitroreductase family protein [Rhodocaloribacter litoris]QXD16192.1 nitroreductase family protein [Rhodocaloribacter litoris]